MQAKEKAQKEALEKIEKASCSIDSQERAFLVEEKKADEQFLLAERVISDANTRLSESIANNDFLGVKKLQRNYCAQKSYEKGKTSRENLKKKRDSIGKNRKEAFSKSVQRVKIPKIC